VHVLAGVQKTKKEEIESFIEKYKYSPSFTDVPVSTMRHIIPLFLIEIYPHEYGQFSRKGETIYIVDTRSMNRL